MVTDLSGGRVGAVLSVPARLAMPTWVPSGSTIQPIVVRPLLVRAR